MVSPVITPSQRMSSTQSDLLYAVHLSCQLKPMIAMIVLSFVKLVTWYSSQTF
jgi:hypothetical protein